MALFFNRNRSQVTEDRKIQDLDIDKLRPNEFQPRHAFSDDSIAELAQTIEKDGLLQPITVRKKDDYYEIIAGERRFRAAQKLGWTKISAIVREMDDQQTASLALIENLQRENLNPIDEAQAYKRLMKLNDLTQVQLAKEVGKSQSYVANKIRLLKLSKPVQDELVKGTITQRHGRALLGLDGNQQQKALHAILTKKLTVKQTEYMAGHFNQYFADKRRKKRVFTNVDSGMQVQVNTIKQAVQLARDSGLTVHVHEDNDPKAYTITIKLMH